MAEGGADARVLSGSWDLRMIVSGSRIELGIRPHLLLRVDMKSKPQTADRDLRCPSEDTRLILGRRVKIGILRFHKSARNGKTSTSWVEIRARVFQACLPSDEGKHGSD